MIRETPAMTVRQKIGDLLNEVQYRRDRTLITKAGKPVAAMIEKRFAKVPPQKATTLIDEAVRATRKSRRRR